MSVLLTRPRQADAAQALRRAATAAAVLASRRSRDAADRLGVRAAGRGQDDAGRELPRSTRPAPPLVPDRHRRQPTPRPSSITCGWPRVQLVGKTAAALPHFNPEPQQDICALRADLLPRVLLRACRGPPSSPSTASRRRAPATSCGRRSRMRSRRFRTASPSSRSRAAIRRRSSPGSSRAAASPGSSRRRSRCTPDEAEAILGSNPLDAQTLQRIHAPKRRLGGGARAAARAPEPRRRDARRVDRRRQGRDLPVLRRRDLQSARSPRTSAS